jgi:hypothetical protein
MSKHATRDDRLRIHSLSAAGFTNKQIGEEVGYSEQRVSYLLRAPVSPRKRKGRPPIFDDAKRQRLADFVTASPENRQMEYFRIPPEVALNACERTIRKALDMENLHRQVQRRKPFLSKINCQKHLLFAQVYEHWDVEDWHEILFTDESSMQCLDKYFFIYSIKKFFRL